MNFNYPVAAPQYTRLRAKSYAGTRLVSLFSNEVVFAGQVNSDLTTPRAWAEFAYNNVTVGAYTDVEDLFALYIGTANNIKLATFEGYCRGAADASKVYCNESSQDFVAGAYFWVVKRIDIKYVQSRPSTNDPDTAVELVNYNQTYQGLLPLVQGLRTAYVGYVNPSSGKLRLGFDVSGSLAAESGATISSILYSIPGATVIAGSLSAAIVIVDIPYGELYGKCTVTDSGSRAKVRRFAIKAHDPVNYPPDTGFEGGTISATLEQGYTASMPAFAGVDDFLNNTFGIIWRADEQFNGVSGGLYGDGASAAITNKELTSNVAILTSTAHPFEAGQVIIIADVGAPFDGTFQISSTTTDTFSYTKVNANIASTGCSGMGVVNPNNVDFVGWWSREDDPLSSDANYSVIATARPTITGVGPRLARLTAQLLAIVNAESPTRWGDVKNCTPWRAMWHFWSRYTTVTTLCDVSFSDTTDTFLFTELSTQGRNALAAVQEIAQQINANVEFAPWGALTVNRDVNFLSATERSALTVVGSWGTSDAVSAPRSIDPNPNVGKVDGVGAYYDPTTTNITAFQSRAPGHAQGEAEGDDTIAAQVLASTNDSTAALLELRNRVGNRFNLVNLRESLDVKHLGNFVGLPLIPSRSQLHWWTLQNVGGPNNVNRINYDTTVWWTIDSVTEDYNPRGVFNIRVRYRRVAAVGDPGDDTTTNLPAPGQVPAIPDLGLDAFNFQLPELSFPDTGLAITQVNPAKLLPPAKQVAITDGSTALAWSATRLELVQNLIALRYPITREINPSTLGAYEHQMALFDPRNKGLSSGNNMAYSLGTDGADSRVFKAVNVFAPTPFYFTGNTFSGIYRLLRTTGTPDDLMVYSPDSGAVIYTDNLTTALGPQTHVPSVSYPFGIHAPTGPDGIYQSTGGRTGGGCIASQNTGATGPGGVQFWDATGIVDLGAAYTVTNASYYSKTDIGSGGPPDRSRRMRYLDTSGVIIGPERGLVTSTLYADEPYTLTFYDGAVAGVRYIVFATDCAGPGNTVRSYIDDLSVTYTDATGGGVRLSTDGGINFGSPVSIGVSPGPVGGFDTQRAGTVSYAACAAKVRKATTLGGAYSDHTAYTGANPVCVIIPWYLWGFKDLAHLNTSNANPDYITALDQVDGDGGTLYLVDGTTAVKTDVTPVAGITFDNANCITTMYGTHIAVIGKVSGVYKLYTSPDTGATWTLAATLGTATFIRGRRGDTRAFSDTTGVAGQLFVCDGDVEYTSKFASAGVWPRTLPITALGVDILG